MQTGVGGSRCNNEGSKFRKTGRCGGGSRGGRCAGKAYGRGPAARPTYVYSEGQKGAAKRAESPEVRLVLHWFPEQEGLVANKNRCKRRKRGEDWFCWGEWWWQVYWAQSYVVGTLCSSYLCVFRGTEGSREACEKSRGPFSLILEP